MQRIPILCMCGIQADENIRLKILAALIWEISGVLALGGHEKPKKPDGRQNDTVFDVVGMIGREESKYGICHSARRSATVTDIIRLQFDTLPPILCLRERAVVRGGAFFSVQGGTCQQNLNHFC